MNKNPSLNIKQQSGVVLIVALFIVALVAGMAFLMMTRLERDTGRTTLIARAKQATLYASGTIFWAEDQLIKNWQEKQPKRMIDQVPYVMPVVNVNGYKIQSYLVDMQARFNINNLQQDAYRDPFLRLLKAVAPKLSDNEAKILILSISHWFKGSEPNSEREEYYLHLKPPYRAAHQAMVSVSELKLVKGVTPALYQLLEPVLCALPPVTKVNMLTAPAEVLVTLHPELSLEMARAFVKEREGGGISDVSDFNSSVVFKGHQIKADEGQVTAMSDYFLLTSQVSIEKQQIVLYTLLKRETGPGKPRVQIIWQSRGSW